MLTPVSLLWKVTYWKEHFTTTDFGFEKALMKSYILLALADSCLNAGMIFERYSLWEENQRTYEITNLRSTNR